MPALLPACNALRVKAFSSSRSAVRPCLPSRCGVKPSALSTGQTRPQAPPQQAEAQNAVQEQQSSNLWLKMATMDAGSVNQPAAIASLVLIGLALSADASTAAEASTQASLHASATGAAAPLFDLSEEPILSNIARYARYFVTVMLGTGYVMLKPFQGLLKNPITAVLGVGGMVAFAFLIKYTVELMLGVEVYEYDPDSYNIVTAY